MMLPIYEYKILTGGPDNHLADSVIKLLKEGWEMIGVEMPSRLFIFKRIVGYR